MNQRDSNVCMIATNTVCSDGTPAVSPVYDGLYEPKRDLMTLVSNATHSTYRYTYDAAGLRISKNDERYGYNVRNELILATNIATGAEFAYSYDDIGNRLWSREFGTNTTYTANCLNQYTEIVRGGMVEHPVFDADGNQTDITTGTGRWLVEYNGENRPVRRTRPSDGTVMEMSYDRMGRRVRSCTDTFVYDNYLNIGNTIWDPTEPVATRPLVWLSDSSPSYYFHDGNKNVSDMVGDAAQHYEYDPFGSALNASSSDVNPWRFSSELDDSGLGLVYYNFRHYAPMQGRWNSLDGEAYSHNLYVFIGNTPSSLVDYIGLWRYRTDNELRSGGVVCNADCKLVVYIPDDLPENEYPKDCVREHEEQHILDLPNDAGCKKDGKGCCSHANMTPEENDYGGRDNLKESECKAYLVTAKCCTRKAGLLDASPSNVVSDDQMRSYRYCVQSAKYRATKQYNTIYRDFGSPCNNEDEFNGLLDLFERYFRHNVRVGAY